MHNAGTYFLCKSQIDAYARDGVVYPIEVLSRRKAHRYRAEFETFVTGVGHPSRYVAMTHLYFRWAFALAVEPKILDAVESILGPELLVQSTLILCKYPDDESFVTWHQDFNYANETSSPTVSAWIALSASSHESGCLRAIPGSQRAGVLPHTAAGIKNNILTYSLEIDESSAIDIELKPGEMSLHQPGLIHGSLPNQSADKRIGFIVRYVTPEFSNNDNPVVRARGNAPCPQLDLRRGPPTTAPNNFSAWKKLADERNLLR
jgi:ectoine hydroxylase-related dioxygenase (phytanoyl-CoA dioxygenase family)